MFTANHIKPYSTIVFWFVLLSISCLSIGLSISLGSAHMSLAEFEKGLTQSHNIWHTIIFQLRLPRTFCAFMTGGLLALAGVLMQTLLRNPLADPYVLGVSGGAAVASLLAILLHITINGFNIWAFIGSFLSILLVMGLARSHQAWSPLRLLLTGVVIATGWAALISLILTVSPERDLRGMLFWLMGDLSYARFALWQPMILLIGLCAALFLAKPLNILVYGDSLARSLGINTKKLNWILYFLSSLLTACAVSIAGCIGFIGLIVPHMLRLMIGSDHRVILPASILLGGSLLTLADTLARTLIAPVQLPVGIVTAIIGVPSFLLLLQRSSRQT